MSLFGLGCFKMRANCYFIMFSVIGVLLSGCMSVFQIIAPSPAYQLRDSTLPVKTVWALEIDETFWNPPIFATPETLLAQTDQHIYSIDVPSGKVLWKYKLDRANNKGELAKLLVAYKGHVLTANSYNTTIQSIDLDTGRLNWEIPLDKYVKARSNKPQALQIIAYEKFLLVLINLIRGTTIVALDIDNGDLIWRSTPEVMPSEMYLEPSTQQLIVSSSDSWWFLNVTNGQVTQILQLFLPSLRQPTYSDQMLFTSGDSTRAIRIPTLEQTWEFTHDCADRAKIFTPPYVLDNDAYILTSCGLLYKLDMFTGAIRWRVNHEAKLNSFIVFQRTGYLLDENGSLNAINLNDGSTVGSLLVEPAGVPIGTFDALATNQEVLILSYGNNQLFAFEKR